MTAMTSGRVVPCAARYERSATVMRNGTAPSARMYTYGWPRADVAIDIRELEQQWRPAHDERRDEADEHREPHAGADRAPGIVDTAGAERLGHDRVHAHHDAETDARDAEVEIVTDAGAGERGVAPAAEHRRVDETHQLMADLLDRQRRSQPDHRAGFRLVHGWYIAGREARRRIAHRAASANPRR